MATVTEHPKPSAALEPRRSRRGRLPFSPWHRLLLPTAVVFALPLVQMVMTSLMSDREINRFPPRFFPSHISLGTGGKDEGGYVGLFTGSEVLRWRDRRTRPRLFRRCRVRCGTGRTVGESGDRKSVV